jgi:hypothetical protein
MNQLFTGTGFEILCSRRQEVNSIPRDFPQRKWDRKGDRLVDCSSFFQGRLNSGESPRNRVSRKAGSFSAADWHFLLFC